MIRPNYWEIRKIIRLFRKGKFELYNVADIGKNKQPNFEIHKEKEWIFKYLVKEGYLKTKSTRGISVTQEFLFTDEGILLKKSLSGFGLVEKIISDYPYLLGSLVGGILGGGLITIIIEVIKFFISNN